ncbi:hypothetical protein Tco_1050266 [Tanacetum coccineum]
MVSGIETIVYADSDHAGDYIDRKSTSGVCTFMGYVSAEKACQQALWMKQALIDYGVRLDHILIMCDNKGAMDLSKNPIQHSPRMSPLSSLGVVTDALLSQDTLPEASSIHIDFGFSAPYFDLPFLRSGIPNKSLTPRIQWDFTPGESFTLPPLIKTIECSCEL